MSVSVCIHIFIALIIQASEDDHHYIIFVILNVMKDSDNINKVCLKRPIKYFGVNECNNFVN